MKKIAVILLASLASTSLFAQEASEKKEEKKPWKTGMLTSATFSQTSFTNWSAGGQNSVALNFLGNFFANYSKGNCLLYTSDAADD